MIQIRPLTTHHDCQQAEEVQRLAWSVPDLEIVPVHLTHALQQNGACLLGAFEGDLLIGFTFGVLAFSSRTANGLSLYSVMAGVRPGYQNRSVGYELKLAQREFALNHNLELITWTYDPLESRNGRFNIHKLGSICRTYHRNHHGELTGINAGLPTDRFEVEWWIATDRVTKRIQPTPQPAQPTNFPILTLGSPLPDFQSPIPNLLVEIPANFQTIKQQDLPLALQWRTATRHLFENLFQVGYVVVDFVYQKKNGSPQSFYQLAIAD